MECNTNFQTSTQSSKNLKRTTQSKTIILFVFFTLITTLLFASLLRDYSSSTPAKSSLVPPPPPPHPLIKNACTNTFYPSLCFTSLSSTIPTSRNGSTTLHYLLEFAINQTIRTVVDTGFDVTGLFTHQDLNSHEKNALNDCADMLDQTLYELGQAIDDLRRFPASIGYLRRSYGNLKTLLSAAMTNENTCIDGFSDLEEYDLKGQKGLKEYLQGLLDPISHMISNCLAMIKYMETINPQAVSKNVPMLINNVPEDEFPLAWMTTGHRRMMERGRRVSPHVVVSSDGIGKHRTIGEAVRMAPNMSLNRYVIRIKAGKYTENVVIPREKVNIILVGDGMNSTVITSSKNFIDGFSTFTSATLTVVGDKFIATDLTIINTAGPQKHQAVALRVNSNAAFYRCNIISYQDTLYAHSLQQFYRECTIQGTIDFIFGNAAAIFQNCLIQVRKPILGQENMITAQGREDPNQNTGISLQNCTIVAAPDLTVAERANFSTFLGRPWRNYSRTIVMKSYLGDLIHPEGWHKWNEYSTLDTVEYTEYMNSGPGSDTRQRVTWAGYKKNCSEDVARQFTVGSFLHGADDWLESIFKDSSLELYSAAPILRPSVLARRVGEREREMCTLEKRGSLFILTLTGNDQHRLNPALIDSIKAALDRVRSDCSSNNNSTSSCSALITTAHGKFFTNGYDLAWAKSGGPASATKDRLLLMSFKFRSLITDLISLPMPTIAAVTGHASAAGFLLALCHDYVLMRKDRGFLYMSELDIALPIPAWFTAVLRSKIGSPMALRDVLLRSAKLTAQAAVERGIIESAHDSAEETVGAAVKLGEELVGRKWDGHVYGQIRIVVFDDLLRAAGFDESVEDPNHVNKVISRL